MNIATYLTVLRIVVSPIFFVVYSMHDSLEISLIALPYVLFCLWALLELSDLCDGYLARKYNTVTEFGKILDPMADSIARMSVFLTFTLPPVSLPIALIFIFLYRDSVVSTLRTLCALKGFTLAARKSGKFKAVIQAIAALAVIVMLLEFSRGQLSQIKLESYSALVVAIAGFYTIISGVEYIYANRHFINQVLYPHGSKSQQ